MTRVFVRNHILLDGGTRWYSLIPYKRYYLIVKGKKNPILVRFTGMRDQHTPLFERATDEGSVGGVEILDIKDPDEFTLLPEEE